MTGSVPGSNRSATGGRSGPSLVMKSHAISRAASANRTSPGSRIRSVVDAVRCAVEAPSAMLYLARTVGDDAFAMSTEGRAP
jgi:hypothetical protein